MYIDLGSGSNSKEKKYQGWNLEERVDREP